MVFAATVSSSELSTEIIAAGRELLGRSAVYHQDFSTDCWPGNGTAASCLERGLGVEDYDCSGLIIAALSAVSGRDAAEWSAGLRHVRQMWHDAQTDQVGFQPSDVAVGSLLVTTRRWRIDGERLTLPGHIGIVTEFVDRAIPVIVHASAAAGRVVEEPLGPREAVLGAITPAT